MGSRWGFIFLKEMLLDTRLHNLPQDTRSEFDPVWVVQTYE